MNQIRYLNEKNGEYFEYEPVWERLNVIRKADVSNKNVIDIGAGKGYLSIQLAKNFDCNITCIDVFPEKIERARNNAIKENIPADKIQFLVEDARNSNFMDEQFDIGICYNVLHHVDEEDRIKVIRELFRITKEAVILSDLHASGANLFDKYIHPEENHLSLIVNEEWVKKLLQELSVDIKRFESKYVWIYKCTPK